MNARGGGAINAGEKKGTPNDRGAVRSAVGDAEETQVAEQVSENKHCAARVQDQVAPEGRALVLEENKEPVIWGGQQGDAADV